MTLINDAAMLDWLEKEKPDIWFRTGHRIWTISAEITAPPYGRGLTCAHCQGKIDVLPEPTVWLDTPLGQIGISMDPLNLLGILGRLKNA